MGRQPAAYIHIGPHKTGSSSIQHFVRSNEAALERLGLYVPKLPGATSGPGGDHLALARARELRPDGSLKPGARLWPELEAATARGADILVSSEMFTKALRDDAAFGPMLAFFSARGYRVVLIAYVRDQPGWLNSWYVQSQKRLYELKTFDEFEAAYAELGRVDPWRYLRPYIGDERFELNVVSFDAAIRTGLQRDFIARCGVDPDAGLAPTGLRNPNAGAKTVYAAQEIMRRVGPGARELEGYGRVYGGFKKRCADAGWADTPYVALDDARCGRIRARYAASNERLARRFFGRPWAEVAPPRAYEPSMFDPNTASRGELAEIESVVAEVAGKLKALRPKSAAAPRGKAAAE